MSEMSTTASVVGNFDHLNYNVWLSKLGEEFALIEGPLFRTNLDPETLWDLYLNNFSEEQRQYHNCSCCRRFIEQFGGLVLISEEHGALRPALWTPRMIEATAELCPEMLTSVQALEYSVRKATVVGLFVSDQDTYGTPITGPWVHAHVIPNRKLIFKSKVKSPHEAMAEKKEDFNTVSRFLSEWTLDRLDLVVAICESDALYRSEKILGQAKWLQKLKSDTMVTANLLRRKNIIWKAVAEAPAGFCHPRSSMIATLLEDLETMGSEQAAERFRKKMNPAVYQRPQAAPKAGAIAQAEKLVAELGAAGSLRRRYVMDSELVAMWRPKSRSVLRREAIQNDAPTPVFGDVVARGEQPERIHHNLRQTMTWVKFRDTVLKTADRIRLHVPHNHLPYGALTTASVPDSPPILQWDNENNRNPVSWYVWVGGARPEQFGLSGNSFVEVTAITLKPCYWTVLEGMKHHGEGVFFVLENAVDSKNRGNAIFPETLKSEFHGVRSVIEAYSRQQKIESVPEGKPVAGLFFFKDTKGPIRFEVFSGNIVSDITIDRWD